MIILHILYIGYKGSNSSIPGWIENLMLSSMYPTKTQELAFNYLSNNIIPNDKIVYVGGHSKGGNLAMSASMNLDDTLFDKIKYIYNFDGPGFKDNEYNSDKFKRMNEKCFNYLPVHSYVGTMFNNQNYIYVDTLKTGFNEHFLIYWKIFGTFVERTKNISKFSLDLHNRINNILISNKEEDIIKLLNNLKDFCIKNNILYLEDFIKNKINFIKLITEFKNLDSGSKVCVLEIFKLFLEYDKNKKINKSR